MIMWKEERNLEIWMLKIFQYEQCEMKKNWKMIAKMNHFTSQIGIRNYLEVRRVRRRIQGIVYGMRIIY